MRRLLVLFPGLLGLLLSAALRPTPPDKNYNLPQGEYQMSELSEAGQVETCPDGSKIFTHGHRFPDNVQSVTQEYSAAGQLLSAKVQWTGFAGRVLDVRATFDAAGKLIKETGFRAPDVTTPVTDMLKPLPSAPAPANPTPANPAPAAPVTEVDIALQVPLLAPPVSVRLTSTLPNSKLPNFNAPVAPVQEQASAASGDDIKTRLRNIYGAPTGSET